MGYSKEKRTMTNVTEELALIPSGEFLMGSDSEGDHNPVHKVYIDTFYMDKYEVTNTKYLNLQGNGTPATRVLEYGRFQVWPRLPEPSGGWSKLARRRRICRMVWQETPDRSRVGICCQGRTSRNELP